MWVLFAYFNIECFHTLQYFFVIFEWSRQHQTGVLHFHMKILALPANYTSPDSFQRLKTLFTRFSVEKSKVQFILQRQSDTPSTLTTKHALFYFAMLKTHRGLECFEWSRANTLDWCENEGICGGSDDSEPLNCFTLCIILYIFNHMKNS